MDIKKEVSKIMALAYETSTTTKSDVFVNYAGHVDSISIGTNNQGWRECEKRDGDFDIRLKKYQAEDQQKFEENLQRQLDEVQLYLIMLGAADE